MEQGGGKLTLVQIKYRDDKKKKKRRALPCSLWLAYGATIIAVGVVGAIMHSIDYMASRNATNRYDDCLRAIQVKPVTTEGKRIACHLNGNQFVVEGKQ